MDTEVVEGIVKLFPTMGLQADAQTYEALLPDLVHAFLGKNHGKSWLIGMLRGSGNRYVEGEPRAFG